MGASSEGRARGRRPAGRSHQVRAGLSLSGTVSLQSVTTYTHTIYLDPTRIAGSARSSANSFLVKC